MRRRLRFLFRSGVLMTGAMVVGSRVAAPQGPQIRKAPPVATALAFVGGTVIDVQSGRLLLDQTVVIANRRIQAVGASSAVRVPKNARVVKASGKYLIPGLWDMHLHVGMLPDVNYPTMIANGVTGIRDPLAGVPLDTLRLWRQKVTMGVWVGPPRQMFTSVALSPTNIAGSFGGLEFLGITTPAEGQRAVDSLKAAGADFIKVDYDEMPRDVYFAVLAEGRRIGIPVVGHLPHMISILEASDSGQRTLEHMSHLRGQNQLRGLCWGDSASVERCSPVAERFRRNGTWITPTVDLPVIFNILASLLSHQQDPTYPLYSRLPWARGAALPTGNPLPPDPDSSFFEILQRSGMPLLAGTDATGVPVVTVHEELAMLVGEGLTPLGALQAATLNPAQLFGLTDSLGTVAPGKLADLVLLEANPLADITNTAKIAAVMADGRYFDRVALDTLLVDADSVARVALARFEKQP